MKSVHRNGWWSRVFGIMALYFLNLYHLQAQLNSVNNPSFEVITQCPDGDGQINYALHWNSVGVGGAPDLSHRCDSTPPDFGNGVPYSCYGLCYQETKSGDAMAREIILSFDPNFPNSVYREYIQNELYKPLDIGRSYCVSMYVALHDEYSTASMDRIGMYIDDGSVNTGTNIAGVANGIPQVMSPDSLFLTHIQFQWRKVSGIYISDGNDTHLSIGNFFDNQQMHYLPTNGQTNGLFLSAYYIDDVSVIPSDLPAYAGEDTVISPGDSVFIGRQPEIGLECVWHSNGQQVGTGAGIWVKPMQTTSYIVTQDLCGNIQQDTVIVYVFPTSVQVPLYLQSVQLFPNPAQQNFTLSLPQAQGQQLSLQLFSPEGKKVWQGTTQSEETDIPLPAESGVYFLEIRDVATGGRIVKKVVRE